MVVHEYDVLIVGGGLAGSSMAAALSGIGISCAVVEAVATGNSKQPSFDDRGLALSEGSRRILKTLGIWQLLDPDTICPIRHIHVSDRGHGGFARMHARQAGVAALGYVVTARNLGKAILTCLDESGAVSRRYSPARVMSIQQQQDQAVVSIEMADGTEKVAARLAILADGGRSGLAGDLGIDIQRKEYRQHAVVLNVKADRPHENTAYERFTNSGPVALLPMDASAGGNRFKVVWTVTPEGLERVLGLPDDQFLAELQDRFGGRAGAFSQPGQRSSYAMVETRVKSPVARRVALVGNAAHTTHPIAGQGFNLGLRDVAGLAEIVYEARRAGQDIGSAQVLEDYRVQRAADVGLIAGFTDSLVRLFSNDLLPLVVARNLGLVTVDRLPWLRRGLMNRMMGLSGRQTRLMRGLPLSLETGD